MTLHKDLALDQLAIVGNVAQFVAFRPDRGGLAQSFSRVSGHSPNHVFADPSAALAALLRSSHAGALNVRSYLPDDPRSREFVYDVRNLDAALGHLTRLAAEGLHLIANETIDVADGGVSGVVHGDAVEFAPDDTPRAVEKPGVAALPRDLGFGLLATVYGRLPEIPGRRGDRVEFSVHPGPRGWRGSNTLLWEIETGAPPPAAPRVQWPNRFSRHVGDKAFGLLIADQLGALVPRTLVISRRVAPFGFGRDTGSGETWIRTCPQEPQPGLFTTAKGWRDPFALLADEDQEGQIASVLAQAGVRAEWSGAAIVGGNGEVLIEGGPGEGEAFMLGERAPEPLPADVRSAIWTAHQRLSDVLGPVRMEWVHDGHSTWIVQLHVGATTSTGATVVEGQPLRWERIDAAEGLSALRSLIARLPPADGIEVVGEVGLTSHVADVLRKAGRPARIARLPREL